MNSAVADPRVNPPIHLTILPVEEVRAALAAHQAVRPEHGTSAFSAWCDKKERLQCALELAEKTARASWSKPFVVPGKTAEPTLSKPSPQEIPMTPPTVSPEEQLKTLLTKFENAIFDAAHATTEKAFEKARGAIYQLRFQIKSVAEKNDLEAPALPEIPVNPWGKKKNEKAVSKAPSSTPVPSIERSQPLSPSAESQSREQVASAIASIRISIWLLMADLEKMSPQLRTDLVDELGLLDAAAHASHCLATGRLEIL